MKSVVTHFASKNTLDAGYSRATKQVLEILDQRTDSLAKKILCTKNGTRGKNSDLSQSGGEHLVICVFNSLGFYELQLLSHDTGTFL